MKTMYYFLHSWKAQNFLKISVMAACILAVGMTESMAQAGCSIACPAMDPPVQYSLSQNCEDTLTAAQLGAKPSTGCVGDFEVELFDGFGNSVGNVVDTTMLNQIFLAVVTATDPADNQQACMFNIIVIDKMPPMFTCPDDVTVPCPTDLDSIPGITQADVMDCSPVTIQWSDVLTSNNTCDDSIISVFTRFYTILDNEGNISTCTQKINLTKTEVSDVVFPPDLKGDDALPCFPPPDLTPENTGAPSVNGGQIINGTFCNLLTTFEDDTARICSGGFKLIRTWTVMDWCTNASTMTVQTIEVRDTTGPVVDAPDQIDVLAGPGCVADVILPPADISDDCSTEWTVRTQGPFGTVEQNGGFFPGIPAGTYSIVYIATNDCGEEGRDTLILNISDQSTPSAVCNSAVSVPLNDMGMTITPAEAFDGGSFDNCGDTFFKVKRMSAPVGYDCFFDQNDTYAFDDVVKFCCEDVSSGPIMVILRVYDSPVIPGIVSDDYLQGHFTDCMIEVDVQDKTGPSIICPSDITISCEYPFDPDNLSVFGSIVSDPADREEICIDDPGDNQPGLVCLGLDGLATDNCDVVIEEEMSMIMDSLCGTGQIIRNFTATDPGGRSVSCSQTITIVNFNPFTENDITWPLDLTTSDLCDIESLDPSNLDQPFKEPIVQTDECDLVTFNFSDEVFDFSIGNEACFKILRTWTVIDWCQLNTNGGQGGRWEYLQTIKVKNTVGPVITSSGEDMDLCSDDPGCGDATTTLEASATDDCTSAETLRWRISIDLENDGDFDDVRTGFIGESVSLEYVFPIGTHRVLYAVLDFCGNTTVEEQFISVESCAGPSAKCKDITTTLMPVDMDSDGETDGGSVVIWASDLDAGSDHPCGLDVTVAFSTDPNDTNLEFTCDDLGPNAVELFVIDENGRTDFCIVNVTIQDNNNVCPNGLTGGTIAGMITTSSVLNMTDVEVQLHGSSMGPVYTSNGSYQFPQMALGGSYEVEPYYDNDPTNGISTIDLVQIQKHLLGIKQLDTPYKIIAADANKSGSVSAIDILELRKLILGITTELPNNTSWRFIDAEYQFVDPADPFQEEFAETYMIDPLSSDMMNINFIGVKVGDVNESAQAVAGEDDDTERMDRTAVQLVAEDVHLQAGEMREVTIIAPSLDAIEAMQFTLEWDRTLIDVMEVIPGRKSTPDQWNDARIDQGILPFSWYSLETADATTDEVFTLRVRAIRSGNLSDALMLSSAVTREEAMTASGKVTKPMLQFDNSTTASSGLVLHQNAPNPFRDQTTIAFEIDHDMEVELLIYDVLGRVHFSREIEATAGYNQVVVPSSSVSARGLVLYTLKAGDTQQTKRMIIEKE